MGVKKNLRGDKPLGSSGIFLSKRHFLSFMSLFPETSCHNHQSLDEEWTPAGLKQGWSSTIFSSAPQEKLLTKKNRLLYLYTTPCIWPIQSNAAHEVFSYQPLPVTLSSPVPSEYYNWPDNRIKLQWPNVTTQLSNVHFIGDMLLNLYYPKHLLY